MENKINGVDVQALIFCLCVQQKVINYSFMRFIYTHKRLLASDEALKDVLMLILSSVCCVKVIESMSCLSEFCLNININICYV